MHLIIFIYNKALTYASQIENQEKSVAFVSENVKAKQITNSWALPLTLSYYRKPFSMRTRKLFGVKITLWVVGMKINLETNRS